MRRTVLGVGEARAQRHSRHGYCRKLCTGLDIRVIRATQGGGGEDRGVRRDLAWKTWFTGGRWGWPYSLDQGSLTQTPKKAGVCKEQRKQGC